MSTSTVKHGTKAGHKKHQRERRKPKGTGNPEWVGPCLGDGNGTTCEAVALHPRQPPKHGTKSGYNKHLQDPKRFGKIEDCPGDPENGKTCTQANRENIRAYRAKRKAATTP